MQLIVCSEVQYRRFLGKIRKISSGKSVDVTIAI